jgi:hypothetical protein
MELNKDHYHHRNKRNIDKEDNHKLIMHTAEAEFIRRVPKYRRTSVRRHPQQLNVLNRKNKIIITIFIELV